ncbi:MULTISPECIES: Sir2 family NAD-dependent protein deacetylase [Cryobacterium]|uniref:protein acetyllysine N-acetyltransferase n=1 Tax=Cryobacterium zongtaii TaxID=1259217 RepID=A0A2S3ZIE0_9MICO|nr:MULTISPECIES: Sir2 family NAD-dependent protein deacetylase [Cryobacterium]ASD22157.1 NAD-dependent deacetylase [Cryobacterium sp. LW097]MEC5182702.1 NAD-dependent SIR2 family protein deacetylase [Cryobacterium sp. MP_3.1]POH61689.1 NAD-dependent deacetylase [Cryobacterium zongtaii]POH65454.1 NAD-dependent deacetylase [Cryobacterium zongtaii]POH67372.1 NAD-dependent deacetylase [Cryobacterium zongtaii]
MTAETVLTTSAAAGEDLDAVAAILRGRRTAVLTGAGVSTDSGIPDYRGAGAPVRVPMTFQTFLADERARKRYWAGSHLGWHRFRAAEPNLGHRSLVALETAGLVSGIITQNVDGLHTRAGSRHVVDLHGSMDLVVCLSCGQAFGRDSIAARLETHNPVLADPDQVEIAPDGDAIVVDIDNFIVPDCSVCGGLLKPNVVFFGELVPTGKFTAAAALVRAADALIVAGSSLAVNSGIRLLEQARRRKLPIVVINRGPTKGDGRALVKLEAGTSETFAGLVSRLTDL